MRKAHLILIFTLLSGATVHAQNLDQKVQTAFQVLTNSYAEKFPSSGMKHGLSVLNFQEAEDLAPKGLGGIVIDLVSRKIITSQIFYLVDRDSIEESVREIKLSLTGMVDDGDLVEAGKMAGVHVFITGTVNQTEREYLITLKMVDVETGIVTGVETVSVEKEVLLDKKKELAFEYISQYGLGINLQYGMGLIDSPLENYSLDVMDLFVNYRPYMWLNFKLGISQYSYRPQSIGGIPFSSIYTDFGSYIPGSSLGAAVNYNSAFFNTLGIYGGIDGNWTPAEFFTLGVGVGINTITPTMIQNYTPLIVDNGGTLEAEGNLIIEQQFWPLTIVRLEVKPQFFLSPRMTLGLYGALMFSNDVEVYKTTVNGDIYYVEDFADGEGIDDYIGLDPRILGDGKNIEDLNFNMKYIIGVSINFYF